MQGSLGVIWGQIPLGMPYENQIWSEEPQTGTKHIDGVEGHAGVTWGQIPLGMPYETQIWSEEPQTRTKHIDMVTVTIPVLSRLKSNHKL